MVILHVFLVWSQEASGKHILVIQRVTSRSFVQCRQERLCRYPVTVELIFLALLILA